MKETRLRVPWYWRELVMVCAIPAIAILAGIFALDTASHKDYGYRIFALGFVAGFIPILIEFVIALRSGRLLIRDREALQERKRANQRLAKALLIPGASIGIIAAIYPNLIFVCVIAAGVGYVLPFGLVLIFQFFRHHKEIEDLTQDLK